MIVFGWNTFLLIKLMADEVGFANKGETVNYHIEVRQKYFHLCWIPFFPIGKMWAIRKHEDNELYELSQEGLMALQSRVPEPKTSWYAYSGLILLGALMVYGMITN